MEKFVITKNENDEFQFNFIDNEGNVILSSRNYTRKEMCINGIESVQYNSQFVSKFDCKTSINNELFFNLKSVNKKIIAISRVFEDKIAREDGINFVMRKASNASIVDKTKKSDKKVFC
jgi:uncharacterized protein YegP (UPF0339 family)